MKSVYEEFEDENIVPLLNEYLKPKYQQCSKAASYKKDIHELKKQVDKRGLVMYGISAQELN